MVSRGFLQVRERKDEQPALELGALRQSKSWMTILLILVLKPIVTWTICSNPTKSSIFHGSSSYDWMCDPFLLFTMILRPVIIQPYIKKHLRRLAAGKQLSEEDTEYPLITRLGPS